MERPREKYQQAAGVANALARAAELGKDGIDPEGDYEVDEKQRSCTLTDEGFAKAEQMLGVADLFNPKDPWAHYITNALKAKELFVKDVNYIVRDGEAVIVDEFTGRVMPVAVGATASTKPSRPRRPCRSTETQTRFDPYQNFLLYPRLAGMTGTAKTKGSNSRRPTNSKPQLSPPTGSARVRTGLIRCTKPRLPNGALWPTKQLRSTRTDGRCSWAPPRWRKRTAEFAAGGAGDPPQPAQRQAETWSANRRSWPRRVGLAP